MTHVTNADALAAQAVWARPANEETPAMNPPKSAVDRVAGSSGIVRGGIVSFLTGTETLAIRGVCKNLRNAVVPIAENAALQAVEQLEEQIEEESIRIATRRDHFQNVLSDVEKTLKSLDFRMGMCKKFLRPKQPWETELSAEDDAKYTKCLADCSEKAKRGQVTAANLQIEKMSLEQRLDKLRWQKQNAEALVLEQRLARVREKCARIEAVGEPADSEPASQAVSRMEEVD